MKKWASIVSLIVLIVVLVATLALAADGESSYPWEDAMLVYGGVAIGVGALVRTIIQFAKNIRINGNPLLPSEASIHLANVLLGGVLFAVVNVMNGATLIAAAIQSGIAILSAIGGHDLIRFLQQAFGGESQAT